MLIVLRKMRPICLLFSLLIFTGCYDSDLKAAAESKVLDLGEPRTDKDTLAVELLRAKLALQALETGWLSNTDGPEGTVLKERERKLRTLTNTVGKTASESDKFDSQGKFVGNGMKFHSLAHGVKIASETAWRKYKSSSL